MGFDKSKAINAAEKCLAQNKIAQAVQEYCKIVEHEPQDFAALNTLGDLYSRLGKTQEAVGCFLRVAEHYREQGFSLKAVAVYKKTLRLSPQAPGVAQNLAVLYEQQGLYVEARAQYLEIADAARKAGQMRESLEALRRIADFDPRNVDIRLRLAESCAGENLDGPAAEAYAEAGELLLARGEGKRALDAYKLAHKLHPSSHAVLQGLVAASLAVGDVDEAAAVLERASADRPADLELRAMLARTYIDAEDATAAERATESLVESDPSSYPLIFEVARLYLQRSYVSEAVRVLARSVEPALAGRQEAALHDILSEALARDPEHIDGLKLLLRIYTWQRDDERSHVTLERLAEAAQTHRLHDEERRALEHLVRLVPFDQSYQERLEALGGARPVGERDEAEDGPRAQAAPVESPAYEAAGPQSFDFDPFAAAPPSHIPAAAGASEFEWNDVAGLGDAVGADAFAAPAEFAAAEFAAADFTPAAVDPAASFADLNEEPARDAVAASQPGAAGSFDFSFEQSAPAGPAFESAFDQQEIHLSDTFGDASLGAGDAASDASADERVRALLAQELESVDFYLEQGYADIARDTLDMLERQYGAGAEIEARRSRLPAAPAETVAAAPGNSNGNGASRAADEVAAAFDSFTSFDFQPAGGVGPAGEIVVEGFSEDPFAPAPKPQSPPPPPQQQRASRADIDPGLAAIFDEFREAVEDEEETSGEDYETTYNLGLAYKEMDLVDEAVEQFQRAGALASATDGTPRYFQCCTMLGHCFMQKRIPRVAATWFKKGLAVPGINEDESRALRYELALAYEGMGDIDGAIEAFSEVYGSDVNYRGVADRLHDLQNRKMATSDK
ncbi:MAG: tetratricopeptide repeat protein [Acidobacteria bacterium]|nr:tetratricopeptide repeat protein [Acidobacteriota bacterium]